jgi:hypothetical protein
MKKILPIALLFMLFIALSGFTQTIPNNDFENWVSHGQYSDPQSWDTPNEEICLFPFYTTVVSKSTDHQSGSFSAKLETKTVPIFNVTVPGVVTLGDLTIDLLGASYEITGGVALTGPVTHLKGFYKFIPKGGDSCAIGIGLTQWVNGIQDSVGLGYFSTHDTVTAWTPFSAWINIDSLSNPDTMNVLAISSAMDFPTEGTVLYLDGLYMDYTVATKDERPSAGIEIYNDRELKELDIFFDFTVPQSTTVRLYNVTGQVVKEGSPTLVLKEKYTLSYQDLHEGIYILNVLHDGKSYSRKFMLNR